MENTELIQRAMEYVKTHCRESISVADIAEHAGFSIDYFGHIFQLHTGFTVMAYVNYNRLKKAAIDLRTTDKSVLDIALDAGYDSHEGFTRAFSRLYGASPSEYRKRERGHVLSLADLSDTAIGARFLHENSDFLRVDENEVIDRLLSINPFRYGYFCAMIQYEGLTLAVEKGKNERGVLAIGDDGDGNPFFEILTDDFDLLSAWLLRIREKITFYTPVPPDKVSEELRVRGISLRGMKVRPQSYYRGERFDVTLPSGIEVRKIEPADRPAIEKWADGKRDGYVAHLLNERHALDQNVLDYGVFRGGEMIAAVECGIDEIRGFRYNNCAVLRTNGAPLDDALAGTVYRYVTNDILAREVLPFDDVQHGEFAASHGGFTTEELGFETVCYRYDPVL